MAQSGSAPVLGTGGQKFESSHSDQQYILIDMGKINIKETVMPKEDGSKPQVYFSHYFDGSLHYKTEADEVFAVPVSDIGVATFNSQENASLMMRYMRMHNKQLDAL